MGGSFALEDTPELIWLQDVLDQNVCILAPEEMEELLSNTLWQEYAGISEISHGIAQVRSAYEEALQCRKQASGETSDRNYKSAACGRRNPAVRI